MTYEEAIASTRCGAMITRNAWRDERPQLYVSLLNGFGLVRHELRGGFATAWSPSEDDKIAGDWGVVSWGSPVRSLGVSSDDAMWSRVVREKPEQTASRLEREASRWRKVLDAPYGAGPDLVNHPSHYTSHPNGIECIDVIEHMPHCLAAAIKYIWRCGLKDGADEIQDLEKARWYIEREISRRKRLAEKQKTQTKTEDGEEKDT